ncbi:ribosome-associated translation inhibitor RaiA [Patescibacteria group bacterium]|nr:ribosome-associated translation inhibitor RaiA [Patescibacteria group bacterium]
MEIKYFVQNFELNSEDQEFIDEALQKLTRFSKEIKEARIDLSYNPNHSKDEVFRLEVNLRLPRKTLRGVHRAGELHSAVHAVEDILQRQLKKYKAYGSTRRRWTQKLFARWRNKA